MTTCADANAAATAAIVAASGPWLAGQGWPARLVSRGGDVHMAVAGQLLTAAGCLSRLAVTSTGVGRTPVTGRARPECGGTPDERDRRRVAGALVRLAGQRAGRCWLPFSAVMVLGVAQRTGLSTPALAPFRGRGAAPDARAVPVALLALHIVTAILDPYVSIGWAATVLPFASGYRTLAVGLGTLAVDLGGAVLRHQPDPGAWAGAPGGRCTGWPTWPGRSAFVHALTAGNDLRHLVGGAGRVGIGRGGGDRRGGPPAGGDQARDPGGRPARGAGCPGQVMREATPGHARN